VTRSEVSEECQRIVEEVSARHSPAVISAGAGTGKTALCCCLARQAVAQGMARPDQIVCITFTRAAAREIRDRVRQAALADRQPQHLLRAWDRAWIGTIHHFARRLVHSHPREAGIDLNADILDEAEADRLVRRAVELALLELSPQEHELFARTLAHYPWESSGNASESSLSASLIKAFCAWRAIGRDKSVLYDKLEENWGTDSTIGRSFAALLEATGWHYDRLRRGRMDYDSLIVNATLLIRHHADIAQTYRRLFKLIIVDEAQDTDEQQMQLLESLCHSPDGPMLVLVGDVKQALYGFRGAQSDLFERRVEQAEREGRLWCLTTNFRSVPGIINFVNDLTPRLFRECASPIVAPLQPHRSSHDGRHAVWCLYRQEPAGGTAGVRRRTEARDVARLIAWLTDEQTPGSASNRMGSADECQAKDLPRIRQFGDIAILMPAAKSIMDIYVEELERLRIPCVAARGQEPHELADVQELLAFLRVLHDPQDRLAWAELLRHPLVGWTDAQWAEALDHPADDSSGLVDRLPDWLRELYLKAEQKRDRVPLASLIRLYYDASGQWALSATRRMPLRRWQVLADVLELACEADRRGLTLGAAIPFVQQRLATRYARPRVGSDVCTAVQLLTIHGAKGLEFSVVILVDCYSAGQGKTVSDAIVFDRQLGLVGKLPADAGEGAGARRPSRYRDTPGYQKWHDIDKSLREKDSRRQLYVAVTRARDLLVLVCYSQNSRQGKGRKSNWLEYLLPNGNFSPEQIANIRYIEAHNLPDPQSKDDTRLLRIEELGDPYTGLRNPFVS